MKSLKSIGDTEKFAALPVELVAAILKVERPLVVGL